MSTISTIFCFQVEINQIVKGNISALSCKNPTSCRRKRIDFRQDEWIDVDFENGGEKKGRRNERRTQFFDEAQHDAADVQVALDAQASLDAEVGDDHSEFPAAVAHHLSVGDHVVVGDRLAIDPDGKAPTGLALLFFRLLADFTDTCEPTRFVRDQTWTEDSSGSLTWLSVCLCVRVCVLGFLELFLLLYFAFTSFSIFDSLSLFSARPSAASLFLFCFQRRAHNSGRVSRLSKRWSWQADDANNGMAASRARRENQETNTHARTPKIGPKRRRRTSLFVLLLCWQNETNETTATRNLHGATLTGLAENSRLAGRAASTQHSASPSIDTSLHYRYGNVHRYATTSRRSVIDRQRSN